MRLFGLFTWDAYLSFGLFLAWFLVLIVLLLVAYYAISFRVVFILWTLFTWIKTCKYISCVLSDPQQIGDPWLQSSRWTTSSIWIQTRESNRDLPTYRSSSSQIRLSGLSRRKQCSRPREWRATWCGTHTSSNQSKQTWQTEWWKCRGHRTHRSSRLQHLPTCPRCCRRFPKPLKFWPSDEAQYHIEASPAGHPVGEHPFRAPTVPKNIVSLIDISRKNIDVSSSVA